MNATTETAVEETAIPIFSNGTSSRFACSCCKKTYTKKSSLDKHKILCEFRMKSNRERTIAVEEAADIPSHMELVKIVQELNLKVNSMENKLAEMHKWVEKKKKKINVVTWLNDNVNPTMSFTEWSRHWLQSKPDHFDILMQQPVQVAFQAVLEQCLCQSDVVYPITCFAQKVNTFYICEKQATSPEANLWLEMNPIQFQTLIKTVYQSLMKQLIAWKDANQSKFNENERLSIVFNKAVIKLTSVDCSQLHDPNVSRIRNALFAFLKRDLKDIIEFEFE